MMRSTRSPASRRVVSALLPLLVASACTRDALPVSSDGGAPLDTGAETCDELRDRVAAWAADHLACVADADCRLAITSCGLPYSCGTLINVGGTSGLAELAAAWAGMGCGANIQCEPCPRSFPALVACNQGVCGPRGRTCDSVLADVSNYLTTHRTCSQDADCAITYTRCGLPGVCGAAVRVDATAALQQLDDEWTARLCDRGKPCPDCPVPGMAVCANGSCLAAR